MEKTKTISIVSNDKKTIKCEKEKRMRVETNTWGMTEEQLSHATQLDMLNKLTNVDCDGQTNAHSKMYVSKIKTHIKHKLGSYKQQDITKKKYDSTQFVSFDETLDLLTTCGLKCCYCNNEVYVLYEHVRENAQWTLDRINNDIGHNSGNVVIACLNCNLKRRRTNKDAFMFTKNMIVIKT